MNSLVSLFLDRVAGADQTALHFKRDGQFIAMTWNGLVGEVRRTAAALRQLGVMPGDRVAQVSENRYEWIVADLAILQARAIHVPIHATLAGPQIAYQINDCQPKLLLVSTAAQVEKLAGEQLPDVPCLSYEACDVTLSSSDGPVRALQQVVEGVNEEDGIPLEQEALESLSADDVATIIYTSGTTGEPKGVMLTHGNLRSNAEATLEVFENEPHDVMLNWLPLSHVYARTCDYYLWLAAPGMELALAESRETIIPDCQAVRPTLLNGVPYFYDKVCRHLADTGQADEPGSIAKLLGGRIRICCAGGAALPDHVAEFFHRQSVRLLQGYGLTESSPVISFSTDPSKIGSIGPPIPGVELKFGEDGELLTRGPHVMAGYWRKPEATAEVLREGWLHTGDLGRFDDDGFIYITGRKKELIVTAAGKNIAPVQIESLLTEDPLILQTMVIGDGRNYLSALIVADEGNLAEELGRAGIECPSEDRLNDPRVREIVEARVQERLAGLSRHEQLGQFTLLAETFSIEQGELTPTLKLRRSVIAQRYADEIEKMYQGGRDVPVDDAATHRG